MVKNIEGIRYEFKLRKWREGTVTDNKRKIPQTGDRSLENF